MSDALDSIRVGDILLTRRGTPRVVRAASFRKDGRTRYVTFAIKRKSWTRRPYTVYTVNDLRQQGYQHTGKRHTFRAGSIESRLHREIVSNRLPTMTPEEVRFVP